MAYPRAGRPSGAFYGDRGGLLRPALAATDVIDPFAVAILGRQQPVTCASAEMRNIDPACRIGCDQAHDLPFRKRGKVLAQAKDGQGAEKAARVDLDIRAGGNGLIIVGRAHDPRLRRGRNRCPLSQSATSM